MALSYDGGTIEVSIHPSSPGSVGGSSLGGIVGQIVDVLKPKNFIGIESISYGSYLETVKLKGAGNVENRGTTPGIIKFSDGELVIWLSELNDWIDSSGGPLGFHRTTFDATVTYRVDGFPMTKVVLQDCRVLDVSTNQDISSAENLTATVKFSVGNMEWNGKGSVIGNIVSNVAGTVRSFL